MSYIWLHLFMRPERVQRLPTKRKKTIGKELTKWKNRDIKFLSIYLKMS